MKGPRRYALAARLARGGQKVFARQGWVPRFSKFPLSRWTEGRDFPALAPKPFRDRWKEISS
jgi:hypothetical protein